MVCESASPNFISCCLCTHVPFPQAKKKGKAPPAKKAKKGSAKRSSAKNARQTKSLSLLPAMPMDVLFEVKSPDNDYPLSPDRIYQIFSHLSPNDIIQLSRTNLVLQDILMTRSATFVWKAARE